MTACPKIPKEKKPRKGMKRSPMNKVGKVGRRRIKTSRLLTAEAKANDRNFCEIAPVLRELGIDDSPCYGPLTNAHSVKTGERGSDPTLDQESTRGCTHHHFTVLDTKTHAIQARVVREAIARREQ